jgi:hypothetical protein
MGGVAKKNPKHGCEKYFCRVTYCTLYSLDEEKSSSLPQLNDFHAAHFQSFFAEAGKRHSTVVHLTRKSNKYDQIAAPYFLVANNYVCYVVSYLHSQF